MKTSAYTPDQIIKIIAQTEKGDQRMTALCREHGIAENTFYRWRKAYGSISVNEAQRFKELEKENARRKRLLAERLRDIDLLNELVQKKAKDGSKAGSRRIPTHRWLIGPLSVCPARHAPFDVPVPRAAR